jgi:hypothetical protein
MEYSTEKKTYTGVILVAAVFLAIGAALIYFLIIAPSQTPPTDTTNNPPISSSGGTDTDDDSTDDDDDIFSPGDGTTDPDTETPDEDEDEDPDVTEDPDVDLEALDDVSWLLIKSGTQTCANTAETLVDVDYTVILENEGTIAGEMSEVIDTLGIEVDPEMVTDISNNGTYDETTSQITWDNNGSGYTVSAGASVTFTYTVRFDEELDQFTAVENDVTAAPGDGTLPPDPDELVLNIGCDIPDTAIGDDDFLVPSLVITGTFLFIALLELKFGLITFVIGEERLDNLKLATGSHQSKSIVEKRLKRKLKK